MDNVMSPLHFREFFALQTHYGLHMPSRGIGYVPVCAMRFSLIEAMNTEVLRGHGPLIPKRFVVQYQHLFVCPVILNKIDSIVLWMKANKTIRDNEVLIYRKAIDPFAVTFEEVDGLL